MAQMIIDSRHAVEGEYLAVNDDFYFSRMGVPIRIMPPFVGDGYEPELLPSQALALCQWRHLLFVALSTGGFLIANTDSVILNMIGEMHREMMREMMREMREPAEAPPAAMAQLINDPVWRRVDVGRVRLLSLSPESSILAACVGGTVNFFSIDELEEMEEFGRPFRSRTIDGGSSVKDMRWLNEMSYILLASCGNLYLGSADGSLRFLMDNVDAVDRSPYFGKIAAARNDRLSILSSNLNDEYHIALSLHPWTQNFDDPRVKGTLTPCSNSDVCFWQFAHNLLSEGIPSYNPEQEVSWKTIIRVLFFTEVGFWIVIMVLQIRFAGRSSM